MPARSTTRLEPPYETNGSGMPVSGAMPSAAARLIGRLSADERSDARREELPERVLAAHRDPESGDREERECADHERRTPIEAELLADDREDHVRVRLREVGDLPHTLAEPGTREAAGADPDRRLHDLEAGALRVAPRVEEAEDASAPVRLDPDREQPDRDARARTRRTSSRTGTPATSEDREHHPAERDRRPEVGLDRIRPQKIAVSRPSGLTSSPNVLGARRRAR